MLNFPWPGVISLCKTVQAKGGTAPKWVVLAYSTFSSFTLSMFVSSCS